MASTAQELQELWKTIERLYGFNTNYGLIEHQIKDFVSNYHYTYSGINYSLIYWHDIKHKQPMPENGIKIVASIYTEARDYKYQLFKSNLLNKNKNIQDCSSYIQNIYISKPKGEKPKTPKDLEIEKFLEGEENNE